jgi:hypothetical protein
LVVLRAYLHSLSCHTAPQTSIGWFGLPLTHSAEKAYEGGRSARFRILHAAALSPWLFTILIPPSNWPTPSTFWVRGRNDDPPGSTTQPRQTVHNGAWLGLTARVLIRVWLPIPGPGFLPGRRLNDMCSIGARGEVGKVPGTLRETQNPSPADARRALKEWKREGNQDRRAREPIEARRHGHEEQSNAVALPTAIQDLPPQHMTFSEPSLHKTKHEECLRITWCVQIWAVSYSSKPSPPGSRCAPDITPPMRK